VLERVAETIRRYGMFRGGERVAVAVSGGADSVCLLDALVALAPRWGLSLSVLHFDHRLRGEESARDARFVEDLARRLGLPFRLESAEVGALARQARDNLEQAARKARREFFLGVLGRGEADRVALGHTRSDQAETVLFRLLRGSGAAGLAGMRPVGPEGFVRPLIEISRREVEQYLVRRGLSWRLDRSNLDLDLARNRIRHELIPSLRKQWNPRLEEVLARTATLAREEEDYWAEQIEGLAGRLLICREGAVLASASALAALPPAAARRLIRRAVQAAKGDLRGIDFGHTEGVMRLAGAGKGGGRVLAPGVEVWRSLDWLRFARAGEQGEECGYRIGVRLPGRYRPPGANFLLCFELREQAEPESGYNTERSRLDWGRISGPLELRNWRPGDRYRPLGHAAAVKLKELFQRAEIPLWERRKWPIMTTGTQIVWVRGFGPAAEYAARPADPVALEVYELPEGEQES